MESKAWKARWAIYAGNVGGFVWAGGKAANIHLRAPGRAVWVCDARFAMHQLLARWKPIWCLPQEHLSLLLQQAERTLAAELHFSNADSVLRCY